MKIRTCTMIFAAVLVTLICMRPLPAAAAEGSFQRTLAVTGPVNLEVTTGSGSIHVRIGASTQVQVTGHIRGTSWFGGDPEDRIKRIE